MNTFPDDPRLVPFYALTQGRTQPDGHDLPWETMVVATHDGRAARARLRFEQGQILDLCGGPVSVAEIAAHLGVPLGVAAVLVSDLNSGGYVAMHRPNVTDNGRPHREILQRLLHGLKAQA
jgi:Protein of unknown function (DUF742)